MTNADHPGPIIRRLNKLAGYCRYRTRWVKSGPLKGAHVVENRVDISRWEFCRHVDELPQLEREIRTALATPK